MKSLKFLLGLLVLTLAFACTSETDLSTDEFSAVENMELEKRTTIQTCNVNDGCFTAIACGLDNIVCAANAGNTATLAAMWINYKQTIELCNENGNVPNCSTTYGNVCENVDVGGVFGDDSCPTYLAMSFCRLECYINNYIHNSNHGTLTEVDVINLEVAFCDHVLSLQNCSRFGYNVNGYCRAFAPPRP